jgi:hypothetical protein
MATTQQLLETSELIRASSVALGEALASVAVYAPPSLARAVQAEQNLHLQIEAEFGLLNSTQAGHRMGSRSKTPRNLASAARNSGRLLAIQRGHSALFPGFQFDDQGQPLLVIAQLRRLGDDAQVDEVGILHWLMGPTTYLDDRRPVDLLLNDPEAVLSAAQSAWNVLW